MKKLLEEAAKPVPSWKKTRRQFFNEFDRPRDKRTKKIPSVKCAHACAHTLTPYSQETTSPPTIQTHKTSKSVFSVSLVTLSKQTRIRIHGENLKMKKKNKKPKAGNK